MCLFPWRWQKCYFNVIATLMSLVTTHFLRVRTTMAPFLVLRKRSGLSAAIFGPCRVYINDEFNLLPLLSVHDILEMLDLD